MYKTKISLFKSLFKSKDVPYLLNLDQVFKRIKEGKSKHIIDNLKDDPSLKTKLPCIMFAGEFIERKKTGLKEHSGLMVLDFDKVPENDYKRLFDELKENKHIISFFRSPSRNGIKGIVHIPKCDAKNMKNILRSLLRISAMTILICLAVMLTEFALKVMIRISILITKGWYILLN